MNFVVPCTSGNASTGQNRPQRRKVVLSSVPAGCERKIYPRDTADRLAAHHWQESVSEYCAPFLFDSQSMFVPCYGRRM